MSDARNEPWEPVRKVRTYEQVMAQIEQRISDGYLRPGDRLPSEREFSQLLEVSRPSLREALRVLQALGIVDVKAGAGRDGGSVFVGSPGSGFADLLRLQLALGHFSDTDVLQTRLALEVWVAAEAARQATEDDIAKLTDVLDRMDDPELSARTFNHLDAEFHVTIAESAGNSLSAHFMGSLRTAIERRMVDAYEQLDDWRRTARTVRQEHRDILAAIERRDAEAAVALVREHITTFYADTYGLGSAAGPRTDTLQP
ncbi:FadR/GntR family transcriptional regulator [Streptomyces sp. NPDC093085]|uniref:FadR/GntR family transcriptional regulator n=1 Tax=Streptomyces sp. NPDC093085 TaxID=3155068 RepID=UPI003437EB38